MKSTFYVRMEAILQRPIRMQCTNKMKTASGLILTILSLSGIIELKTSRKQLCAQSCFQSDRQTGKGWSYHGVVTDQPYYKAGATSSANGTEQSYTSIYG